MSISVKPAYIVDLLVGGLAVDVLHVLSVIEPSPETWRHRLALSRDGRQDDRVGLARLTSALVVLQLGGIAEVARVAPRPVDIATPAQHQRTQTYSMSQKRAQQRGEGIYEVYL